MATAHIHLKDGDVCSVGVQSYTVKQQRAVIEGTMAGPAPHLKVIVPGGTRTILKRDIVEITYTA